MRAFSPDVQGGWQRRIGLDRAFFGLLFIVMMDRLTENPWHEGLAMFSAAVFIFHLALNRSWLMRLWKSVRRRRTLISRLEQGVTLLAMALFAAAWGSGVVVSQTLFSSVTPLTWQSDLDLRAAHVAISVAFFLVLAFHAGFKAEVLVPSLSKRKTWKTTALAFFLAAWGATAFCLRGFPELLSFEAAYITVERDEGIARMPLDFLAVFLGLATAAFLLRRLIMRH